MDGIERKYLHIYDFLYMSNITVFKSGVACFFRAESVEYS